MDLRALRYFVATVEQGSITAAAESCFVAQPSITSAVQKLEGEFGVQLLERSKKGVVVTSQGQAFYNMALSLLQHAELIRYRMRSNHTKQNIRITAGASISYHYVDWLIQALRQHLPHCALHIARGDSETEPADVYITLDSLIPADCEFFPLWRDEYCLVLPKDHDLAYREVLQLEDFQHVALVERRFCETRVVFDQLLRQHQIEFDSVALVDNEEWALQLVASGVGVAFAPVNVKLREQYACHTRPLSDIAGFSRQYRVSGVALTRKLVADPSLSQLLQTLNDQSLFTAQKQEEEK